eukprot:CAMPEP_0180262650 /NCGR_PEP_ID=MMETSP0987-20121128/44842_1 /TAXON_ID=697907 /ORGANISM="non described non described, Strain CCMP2293" /LENGTH=198 /DNA_ID=CAMNT_0022232789 /DNA_START=143 /DNA_END=737 /DNA_ORIENTATION=+
MRRSRSPSPEEHRSRSTSIDQGVQNGRTSRNRRLLQRLESREDGAREQSEDRFQRVGSQNQRSQRADSLISTDGLARLPSLESAGPGPRYGRGQRGSIASMGYNNGAQPSRSPSPEAWAPPAKEQRTSFMPFAGITRYPVLDSTHSHGVVHPRVFRGDHSPPVQGINEQRIAEIKRSEQGFVIPTPPPGMETRLRRDN